MNKTAWECLEMIRNKSVIIFLLFSINFTNFTATDFTEMTGQLSAVLRKSAVCL